MAIMKNCQEDANDSTQDVLYSVHKSFLLNSGTVALLAALPNTATAVTKKRQKKKTPAQHSVDCNRKFGPDTTSPGFGGGDSM
eukprot:CAMPEP_0172568024 /NCGR_PEP_ID=MMETSP1067-20121228/118169_1 /TAXON_ID=265564 ORGANISM="Thalassiosira punctigera, Strain Tpunct2005C2" /NCGR_SAMPLE_ID=MMETSP1067 /ASSEMBLY_ACC=CAM_ASM_000444 /LENGTH=82 /DNA_ID=CAMNT_0013359519 /DNA_START=90 /DNA_END=339 /DNA_ORIENTATION=+